MQATKIQQTIETTNSNDEEKVPPVIQISDDEMVSTKTHISTLYITLVIFSMVY